MDRGREDEASLQMYVNEAGSIIISTEHWFSVDQINTKLTSSDIWEKIQRLTREMGKRLVRHGEDPYMSIDYVTPNQAEEIIDKTKQSVVPYETVRIWKLDWTVENPTLPNWINPNLISLR